MVPQPPLFECIVGLTFSAAQTIAKRIKKRIQIVVTDDECTIAWFAAVVFFDRVDQLQPNRCLAGTFFAKHNGCGRVGAVAKHLVPGGVINCGGTVVLENVVNLSVFLTERIDSDTVVLKKLLDLHCSWRLKWIK